MDERQLIAEALRLLGVDRLVLSLQDASFPTSGDADLARGSPYSAGARRFLAFARELGFTGVQLGPQGLQDGGSASPYEAAVFSRNPLNLDADGLVEAGLLERAEVAAPVEERPAGSDLHADHPYAFAAAHRLLALAHQRAKARPALAAEIEAFALEQADWLEPDALYGVLCAVHANGWWRTWAGPGAALDQRLFAAGAEDLPAARERVRALRQTQAEALHRHAFDQWVLQGQHRRFRETLHTLGLRGYGDLQVGLSARDEWAQQGLLLPGYRMGAPPSRTNPEGQPWNYPVLDPARYRDGGEEGPALAYLRARVRRLLEDHDGLRVDHPHGLVCPWVYREALADPVAAVQHGARLFSSPALPDHPALARFAIAREDQLNPDEPRFADGRVRDLSEEQVARYSLLFDAVMDEAARRGARAEVLGEVLSTMPCPLRRVFERHGLGRFRVTQKANPRDPADVYRTANAAAADWVMLGNHDTPPIWRVIARWREHGGLEERIADLVSRLAPEPGRREALAETLRARDGAVAEALLADALACPARNVQIFFADLLGLEEVFNTPGTISEENWRLRVPPDYALVYPLDRRARRALNLPGALALALRSRGEAFVGPQRELIEALEARASCVP
jgi:4-alpha-glucanotransferase